MNYVGKAASLFSISEWFDLNRSTLTGAIDIIVVKQEDGTYMSTPFHVRFGKFQLLRSNQKRVHVYVNDQLTNLRMKLGNAGEAFFVEETGEYPEGEIPAFLTTSPLTSPPPERNTSDVESDNELASPPTATSRPNSPEPSGSNAPAVALVGSDAGGPPSPRKSRWSWKWGWGSLPVIQRKTRQELAEEEQEELALGTAFTPVPLPEEYDPAASTTTTSPTAPMSPPPTNRSRKASRDPLLIDYTSGSESESEISGVQPPANAGTNGDRRGWKRLFNFFGKKPESTPAYLVAEPGDRYLTASLSAGLPASPEGDMADTDSSDDDMADNEGEDLREGDLEGDDEGDSGDVDSDTPFAGKPVLVLGDESAEPKTPAVEVAVTERPDEAKPIAVSTSHESSRVPRVALSRCRAELRSGQTKDEQDRIFASHAVDFMAFDSNPGEVLSDPNLVVRVDDRCYPWGVAAPILLAVVAYGRTLSDSTMLRLEEAAAGVSTATTATPPPVTTTPPTPATSTAASEAQRVDTKNRRGFMSWWRSSSKGAATASLATSPPPAVTSAPPPAVAAAASSSLYKTVYPSPPRSKKPSAPVAIKSLRPTSEQLAALPLRDGPNTIRFVVVGSDVEGVAAPPNSLNGGEQTQQNGPNDGAADGAAAAANRKRRRVAEVTATLYLWHTSDKIVVSDIDGTITKSDVLGHVLPLVGRDWSHLGVCQLYSLITQNGYKIVYLTSRPLGQAGATRLYIDGLSQLYEGSTAAHRMPKGPVLTSPDGLLQSISREVIRRRPEEFKIACLQDVRRLFGDHGKNPLPFVAGFGNKHNDVIAYTAVGIPRERIFTINAKGEIRIVINTYKKTYRSMAEMVDAMFPPLPSASAVPGACSSRRSEVEDTWNDFQYWSLPLPSVKLPATVAPSKDKTNSAERATVSQHTGAPNKVAPPNQILAMST